MTLPKLSKAFMTSPVMTRKNKNDTTLYNTFVQGIFLSTGVFSTCVAQFIFYQGAGDQTVMLLPLCNYMGMMLVGLLPAVGITTFKMEMKDIQEMQLTEKIKSLTKNIHNRELEDKVEPELTFIQRDTRTCSRQRSIDLDVVDMELIRRSTLLCEDDQQQEQQVLLLEDKCGDSDENRLVLDCDVTPSSVSFSLSTLQLCIILSVVLDFSGCIFSNVGLSMAGSGLYQVVYSSVICWSALMSRFILRKVVSIWEWFGIALVTFGLAFSALGGVTNWT
ncbi:unnamed protein product [Peronospora belbahrii]|uniref:EamA domain-containing protein n=1 Tax=Peronospora belbahrii TaxID=622444 RepID=A0AAU9KUC4_9STRA|nr:unnamed protein product [Peronospora belbahrii]